MTSTSSPETEQSACGCDAIDTPAPAERMACDDNCDDNTDMWDSSAESSQLRSQRDGPPVGGQLPQEHHSAKIDTPCTEEIRCVDSNVRQERQAGTSGRNEPRDALHMVGLRERVEGAQRVQPVARRGERRGVPA